jgi:phospholipid-transporting ATPase
MLSNGDTANQWVFGQMLYTAELITITLKAALVIDTWVNFTWFALIGSVVFWFIGLPVYAVLGPMIGLGNELLGMNAPMFGTAAFWFGILILPLVVNLRDFVWRL